MQTVRIHAHSDESKQKVRVEAAGTDGQRQIVCASEPPPKRKFDPAHHASPSRIWGDCVADVAPGSQLLVTLGDGKEGHVFAVPNEPGGELDLQVLPATRSEQKASGTVMLVVGATAVFGGAVVLPLYSLSQNVLASGDPSATASLILIAAGVVVGVIGVIVLASGSREPLVESRTMYGAAAWEDGRERTFLADVASARPRDRSATLPTITPLSYSFRF